MPSPGSVAVRALCALLGLAALVAALISAFGVVPAQWPEALRHLATPGRLIALAASAAAGVVLAARGWPPGRLLTRIPAPIFLAVTVAAALASGIWANFRIQKHVPDVPDEMGYLHQARTFASGHLTAPSPPAREFHYVSWGVHDHDRWYAVFPPGYGVLLAPGAALGAEWIVNPILGALLVLVLFALARRAFEEDLAPRVAVLLYLASWFRLMHAGSYMAHPTAALFTALAALGLWRGLTTPSRGWAAAGGASLAFLAATRQLDAVLLTVAIAPAIAGALATQRRRLIAPLAAATLAALPITGAYLAYNGALTGDALLPPQQRYMQLKERRGDCFRLGFGPGVGECPLTQNTSFGPDGFRPRHAVASTGKRLEAWHRYSFGWAPLAILPALGLLGGAVLGGTAGRRRALAGGVLAATILGYGLFFYHGVAYGARFYYGAFPIALLLSTAALVDVGALLDRHRVTRLVRGGLAGLLPALLVIGLIADWPAVDKHAGQRNRSGNGAQITALAAPDLRDALVFVDSMVIPAAVTERPTDIDANRPLVAKDLGDAADAGYARLHPGRRVLRLRGTRLEPMSLSPSAPMRHEGGALYPLDDFAGGFPDRVDASRVGKLPLSLGEALRFAVDRPGARFAFPVYVLPDDAGAITLDLLVAAHPRSPDIDVAVDGVALASARPTRAPSWALVSHPLAVTLPPGQHWVTITTPSAGAGDTFYLDYAELRPAR